MPIRSHQDKLLWLEALRASAAIWVLLHHAVQAARVPVAEIGPGFQVMLNGFLGVDFFFVLSGFIIAMSCERLLADGRGVRDYFRARLTRIYVPYLPVGLAMLLLYTTFPGVRANPSDVPGVVTSVALLPSDLAPALAVAWTLVHELVFYALFSLAFLGKRVLIGAILLWCAAIGVCWFFGITLSRTHHYFLAPINLSFVVGVLAYYATKSGVERGCGPLALLVGTGLIAWQALAVEPQHWLATIGFFLIVVAAASPELTRWNPGRPLIVLGAASYSVYLIHKPTLAVAARVISRFGVAPTPEVTVLALAVPALLAGVVYFYLYEKRALRFVRQR